MVRMKDGAQSRRRRTEGAWRLRKARFGDRPPSRRSPFSSTHSLASSFGTRTDQFSRGAACSSPPCPSPTPSATRAVDHVYMRLLYSATPSQTHRTHQSLYIRPLRTEDPVAARVEFCLARRNAGLAS
ncbi:hypothetical protein PsYK624_157980 [Phanerochaete sordida]|uniref:Uncharacterized protein n=1 Tax=Phanerochaete sordida TaxID=48140 RepID=A0A9P3GQY4_9APHY|nr:hypothetical protein PsYK624_157980 [Phanerochaete sordida]